MLTEVASQESAQAGTHTRRGVSDDPKILCTPTRPGQLQFL